LSASPEAAAEAVIELVQAHAFAERVTLVGFDWRALLHARRLAPAIACWFTTAQDHEHDERLWAADFSPSRFGSIPKAVHEAGGEGWFADHRQLRPETAEDATALGLKLGVWTVNDAAHMRTCEALGVDALCTDRPDVALAL
jgi:glycerophosphoryl diester phosphodiesterase